jgi:hypothetical protein
VICRDPLVLQRLLAELAAVEVSVRTVLLRLQSAYPPLAHCHEDDERLELSTAHLLVAFCHELLVALHDHRGILFARLRALQIPDQTAWPF